MAPVGRPAGAHNLPTADPCGWELFATPSLYHIYLRRGKCQRARSRPCRRRAATLEPFDRSPSKQSRNSRKTGKNCLRQRQTVPSGRLPRMSVTARSTQRDSPKACPSSATCHSLPQFRSSPARLAHTSLLGTQPRLANPRTAAPAGLTSPRGTPGAQPSQALRERKSLKTLRSSTCRNTQG